MSRINTAVTIADAPEASQDLRKGVEKMRSSTPNMFRLIGNSPATLEGYLSLNGALGKGQVNAATRERVALAIANCNRRDYCNSADTYLGKNLAKLSDAKTEANRDGRSTDTKVDAAIRFATKVARERGRITQSNITEVRNSVDTDAELVEIVGRVALNVLTNHVDEGFETEVDVPVFQPARAA